MVSVKFKKKSALEKRFVKITANGGVKRKHSYTSHLAHSKSPKRKRHLRGRTLLHKSDFKRLRKMFNQ